MNKLLLTTLFICSLSTQTLFCQELYFSTLLSLRKTNIDNCSTSEQIFNSGSANVYDLAFHTNGNLYVIVDTELYQFDLSTNQYILVGPFFPNGNPDEVGMTSLTCGNDGKLYGAGAYNGFDNGRLYEININTGLAVSLGELPLGPAGDLAFLKGKLYLTAVDGNQYQQLIDVNINTPESSVVLCDLDITLNGQNITGSLYGLMGYTTSCNESYLIGAVNTHLFLIDVETCVGTHLCTTIGSVSGMTMQTDYIAQECCSIDAEIETNNPNCSNPDSGSITIQNNSNNYEYLWSTGSTSSNIDNLNAGNYSVTLTTTGNCSVDTIVSLVEPQPIIITGSSTNASCENNGSIDISVSGGSGVYSYSWSPNGGTVEDPQNLASDSYSVVVTDTDGCTGTFDIDVNSDDGVEIISITATDLLCFNDSSGSIDIEVASGTSPYSYLWNINETTQDLDNLAAGTYVVTVTDSDGCSASTGITLTEPEEITISSTTEFATCGESNGSISLTINGGSTPYSYLWQDISSSSPNPENLATGFYTVTVTDGNNCSAVSTILVPSPANITLTDTVNPISCFGDSTGSISVTPNGGSPPYSYLWNTNENTNAINNLTSGTYQVTVTDANNCLIVNSYIVTEPSIITINYTSTNTTCGEDNGSITLTVSGGVGNYQYQWSSGLENIPNPTNLLPGNYSVTVTDGNFCTSSTEIMITTPNALSLSTSTSSLLCHGGSNGSVELTISGGVPPYSYVWNTGAVTEDINNLIAGNYSVTVTDADTCSIITSETIIEPEEIEVLASTNLATCNENNGSIEVDIQNGESPYSLQWSNGSNSQSLENLTPGLYELTVSDDNQCTAYFQTTIDSSIPTSLNSTVSDISCNGAQDGSILIDLLSGEAPFSFLWNINSTSQNLNGLSEGIYSLTITDAYACTTQITETINEPAALEAFVLNPTDDLNCNGDSDGSIQLQVTGGVTPYSFIWNNGEIVQNPENLSAGEYIVTITDFNNCTTTIQTTISQPEALELNCNVLNHVSSPNGDEGQASVDFQGGTPPFQVSWTGAANGSFFQDNSGVYSIDNLVSGNYTVVITDSNNCTIECQFEILEFECNLTTELNGSSLECHEDESGMIDLTIINGIEPFIIDWNENIFDGVQNLNGLSAGEYTVTVTDAFDCSSSSIITLSQPEEIIISYLVECYDESSGSLVIEEVTGGIGTIEYALENTSFQEATNFPITIEQINGGNLELTIQYNDFCQESFTINIPSLSDYQLDLGEDLQLILGESIELEAETNFNPLSIIWSPTQYLSDSTSLTSIASPLNNSTYTISALAENGCSVNDQININIIVKPSPVFIPNVFSPNGDGFNDFFTVFAGNDVEQIEELSVYNRWGANVFYKTNFLPNNETLGWDGTFKEKQTPEGVYTYFLKVRLINGDLRFFKGDLTLVK